MSTSSHFPHIVQQRHNSEKVAEQEPRVWFCLNCSFHSLIRQGVLLSVEIYWQPIRTFSSAACLQRFAKDRAMNEGAVPRGQPKVESCLLATPSLSDPSTGHAKPISRKAFKISPYLSQAIPGQLADRSLIGKEEEGNWGRPSFQKGH